MCSPANQYIIDQVVAEFVQQSRAFTAFDVSLESKNRGANERHGDMRNYIHGCKALTDECEFGNYTKTNCDMKRVIKGHPVFAQVYHPNGYDVSQYQPVQMKDTVSAPTQPTVVAIIPSRPALSAVVDDGSDDGETLDYRGRLWVLAGALNNIGAEPNKPVYVFQEGNAIMIAKNDPQSGAKAQMVEPKGGIHLSGSTLTAYGLSSNTGDKFVIENADHNNEKVVKITLKS